MIKELWDKGPSNEWYENIEALRTWGYLDGTFAAELAKVAREFVEAAKKARNQG